MGLADIRVVPARGLIVNGSVPVKIEADESPIQCGGGSITIDGTFLEVCADCGITEFRE